MNNLFSKDNIIKALLFLGAALIIVWLLPRKQGNAYHYEMGKPWSYSLLTAPSDMPIYLDTIRAQYMRDSITRNFVPVYVRDVTAEKSTVSAYAARINATQGLELSPGERNQLINALRNILENGIVDQNTYQDVRAGKLTEVRFIHDNTAISIPTGNFLSARAAYSSLDSLFNEHRFRKAIELTAMSKFLTPTISLDTAATKKLFEEVLQKAMAPVGVIQQGERIIDKGDIVTPELYTLLKTYDRISKTKSAHQVDRHHYPILGQLLYVIILLTCLYLFLALFRWRTFNNTRYMVFIMSLITAFVLFAYGMSESFRNGLYMVPFTVVAIMMVVFFDGRTAFFVYLIQVLLCAIISTAPLEFLFLQIIAGIVAISSLKELNKRSQLVRAALFIFISYCLSYVAMEIMQTGTLDKLNPRMFGYLGVNAVLISFAYVLVFVIEKLFGCAQEPCTMTSAR